MEKVFELFSAIFNGVGRKFIAVSVFLGLVASAFAYLSAL